MNKRRVSFFIRDEAGETMASTTLLVSLTAAIAFCLYKIVKFALVRIGALITLMLSA